MEPKEELRHSPEELLELARSAVGFRRTHDSAIGKEDLIQVAVMTILRSPPKKSNGWKVLRARGAVRQLIFSKQCRTRKHQKIIGKLDVEQKLPHTTDLLEDIEEASCLSEEQKTVLRYYLAGWTFQDISKFIGTTKRKVQYLKESACKLLRKALT